MKKRLSKILFKLLLLIFIAPVSSFSSENMMIIIIDGARYSETFGDISHSYIPKMWDLSRKGTIIDAFYNDSLTYTSRAVPALWCGSWTEVRDTIYANSQTSYAVKPTIFEYFRKDKNLPAEQCYYVLKYISSLWLPSFDRDYGPGYWPQFRSQGSTDRDVSIQVQLVMNSFHPRFIWVYLADVDHAGHSGNWDLYTKSIQTADSIVNVLWNRLQADPFYQNSTTLFVTNDHGRHDDQHGGFQHHGDDCPGCRHIQFLALGPEIKQNYISSTPRRIPDMTVTAGHILDIQTPRATGEVMTEILEISAIKEREYSPQTYYPVKNFPNPFNSITKIQYRLSAPTYIRLHIYNINGKLIKELLSKYQNSGDHSITWNGTNQEDKSVSSGLYICRFETLDKVVTHKMLLVK